jgi:excisionase family DNA binding protein
MDLLSEILTVDEAAALLRVNRKTLYEAIRLDQLPGAVIRLGRAIRIRREALLSSSLGNGGPALGDNR